MVIIPTFQDVSSTFTQRIELDGVLTTLKIQWNSREENWYLDISDQDENLILSGIKLVPSYPLLAQCQTACTKLTGELYLIDVESTPGGAVTFENLSVRYILTYLTEEENSELQPSS